MDPDATLALLLETADYVLANHDRASADVSVYTAESMAEWVLSLHNWLSNGGYLPRDWRR